MQKEEATSGNLSLALRCTRSINHIQGKNLPSKFCATAREARGSCSSQVLDREWEGDEGEGEGGALSRRRTIEEKEERQKAREALLGVIVVYHFSKSFYPILFPPPLFLFLLSVTSSFPLLHRLSLPLPFCLLRHEEHRICRGRSIRFHVYTQDGSDWPGLKPSQITP